MTDPVVALDITSAVLPEGRVSIEASAGTGKTFSLSVLVARYVAETDLAPEGLLLLTYTKEATRELRTRTRERCQEALAVLRSGATPPDWMATMAAPGAREAAVRRLDDFLSRFDEVTVTTIHGFCQAVLRRAGASSPVPDASQVEADISSIVDQVITDELVGPLGAAPHILGRPSDASTREVRSALGALRKCVMAVLGNPGAEIVPVGPDQPLGTPDERILTRKYLQKKQDHIDATRHAEKLATLVRRIVTEVRLRTDTAGILTYDDMIRHVAAAVSGDDGRSFAADLAGQYSMVMVDEFQDTDLLQWEIFRTIHEAGRPSGTLITVGDPKQAIYRFRGADVAVYVAATRDADERYALGVNWRSDGPLLDALARLFDGMAFDATGQALFETVDHAPGRGASGLGADPGAPQGIPGSPLEIRVVGDHEILGSSVDADGKTKRNSSPLVTDLFFADTAHHIVEMLRGATIPDDGPDRTPRAVTPGDVAVLVNSHGDAENMVAHLRSVGVPAVRLKTGSVLETEAARQWQILLAAVARPGRVTAVRTFGLSWFSDTGEDDLRGDGETIADLQRRCAELGDLLSREGLVSFYLTLRNDPSFLARVLGADDGERNITDLDHLAEMLASHPRLRKAGPAEYEAVLARMIDGADAESDDQKRRIETDRTAVTVMTRHASKGLQFPIVYLPTLAKKPKGLGTPWIMPAPVGPDRTTRRIIDVGSAFGYGDKWIWWPTDRDDLDPLATSARRKTVTTADADHDAMRLLYVAMTRAQHKLVLYWSATDRNPNPPIARLLRHATGLDTLPSTDTALAAALAPLVTDTGGAISVTLIEPIAPSSSHAPAAPDSTGGTVAAAPILRDQDTVTRRGFGRWSYSGITRRAEGDHRGQTAPRGRLVGAEADAPVAESDGFAWHGIPAGARFGTAVHKILDAIDPATATLEDLVHETELAFAGWPGGVDVARLARLLHDSLDRPLGTVLGGSTLRALGTQNRLSEVRFDFLLPHDAAFTVADLVDAALAGKGAPGFPAELVTHLVDMKGQGRSTIEFAGYMTGSIDALFRVPGTDGGPDRFVVSDYKTNLVHTDDDADPAAAYVADRLAAEMARHGYFVQSLIYTVALHRYLRWRLPDYDYDTHVAGVSYLFLRGLDGRIAGAAPHGIFEWNPPRASVEALDRLFAGDRR